MATDACEKKNTFNFKKIVKIFSINLKKSRWKFEKAMETIRKENRRNLKDGGNEL